jgi:hypothetical protein
VYTKPEVVNRNKRLFGSLMDHLGLAKENLAKDSEKIRKQKEVEHSAAARNAAETQKIIDLRKRQLKEKLVTAKINKITETSIRWRTQLTSFQGFILTETEPKLPWLPARSNKITSELLQKRQDEVSLVFYYC